MILPLIFFLILYFNNLSFSQNFWTPSGFADTSIGALGINQNDDIFVSTLYGIYCSSDNGLSWHQINNPDSVNVVTIEFFPFSNIYLGTFSGLYRYIDNGSNWNIILHSAGPIYAILIEPNGDIFASMIDYGLCPLVYSSNNGNSWDTLSIHCVRDFDTNLNGDIFAGADGGIYRSTDYGNNWILLMNSSMYNINIDSKDYIYAGGGIGVGLFKSTDNGNNWNYLGLDSCQIHDIEINSEDDIFIGTYDGVFMSTDNGQNFVQINSGLNNNSVTSLKLNSNDFIFAGTKSGLFKSIKSTTAIKYNSNIFDYELYNFPNPFKTKTIINYSIPLNYNDIVKINIYNLNGKLIEKIVNKKHKGGSYSVIFYANRLNTGIYYYSINCKNFNQIKKMILIK